MDPKALKPGDERLSPEQHRVDWERDMANDLHNDDALWLWAVKAAHVFMEWRTKGIVDPVLYRLFNIGLFDWTGEDDRLHQTTPAMRHATVVGIHLFRRIIENDVKVHLFAFCNLCEKANIVLAQQNRGECKLRYCGGQDPLLPDQRRSERSERTYR